MQPVTRRVRRAWAPPTGTAASAKWAGCARTTPAWVRLAGGPPLRAPTPNPPPSAGSAGPATPRTRHTLPAADVRGETDVPGRALRGHRWRLASQAATWNPLQPQPRAGHVTSEFGAMWTQMRFLLVRTEIVRSKIDFFFFPENEPLAFSPTFPSWYSVSWFV